MSVIPQSIESLAHRAQHQMSRLRVLTHEELSNMVDALTTLVSGRGGATVRIPMPFVQVAPAERGWQVLRHDGNKPHTVGTFDLQEEALTVARELARDSEATLWVHRADGSLKLTYHYGDGPEFEQVLEDLTASSVADSLRSLISDQRDEG